MHEELLEKLWAYIAEFNPELMFSLQENYSVRSYLDGKMETVRPLLDSLVGQPDYVVTEVCMAHLTADLKPSRYQYIRQILETDFAAVASVMREGGTLTCEIISMIEECEPLFEAFGFSEETEDDRQLMYAVIGTIDRYLTSADLSV